MKKFLVTALFLGLAGCGELLPPEGINLSIAPNAQASQSDTQSAQDSSAEKRPAPQDLNSLLKSYLEKMRAERQGTVTGTDASENPADLADLDPTLFEEGLESIPATALEQTASFPAEWIEAYGDTLYKGEYDMASPAYPGQLATARGEIIGYGEMMPHDVPSVYLSEAYSPGDYPRAEIFCEGAFATASEKDKKTEAKPTKHLTLKSPYIQINQIFTQEAEILPPSELQALWEAHQGHVNPEDPLVLEGVFESDHPTLLIRADMIQHSDDEHSEFDAWLQAEFENYLAMKSACQ